MGWPRLPLARSSLEGVATESHAGCDRTPFRLAIARRVAERRIALSLATEARILRKIPARLCPLRPVPKTDCAVDRAASDPRNKNIWGLSSRSIEGKKSSSAPPEEPDATRRSVVQSSGLYGELRELMAAAAAGTFACSPPKTPTPRPVQLRRYPAAQNVQKRRDAHP
jgi:hypothetical protein